jgi:hypothetical protein
MATELRQQTDEATAAQGEPCQGCGAMLAEDQRYCLNCGRRRAGVPVPFARRRESAATGPRPGMLSALRSGQHTSTGLVLLGVAAFALVLGLGVLIGSLGSDDPQPVQASRPQVITVAAATGATNAPAEFSGDWPEGKQGYTIQLQSLPKDRTDVAAVQAAKSGAESKGAKDVGALDSDDFSSLGGGNYVIYAGVFDTRKQANKKLRALKKDFPGARVVKVSSGGGLASRGDAGALSGKKKEANVGKDQLKELQKLSPEEYQKKARKLPDTTKLPGKAPPKDKKKPGGGEGGGEVIE